MIAHKELHKSCRYMIRSETLPIKKVCYMSRTLRQSAISSSRGNALLRIARRCWRRDKTELSHHADVIAGRVVIGDFAVSEPQPVNMIGLEVFSSRCNAY